VDDAARPEAVERLLESWRGEIQAGAIYELIAQREQDPRRAEILRKMSEAEASHRRRLETRLLELGVPVPDPSTVKIGLWMRLQARMAPISRLLAQRERAEQSEIEGRYRVPTGDEATDKVLAAIRREEQTHSHTVREMRATSPETAENPVQDRLDRITGRERWHRTGTSWVSGAIYGANDGLAAVFGIVSGVSGATGGSSLVLTAGLAGAVSSALSMATGAYLAERSQAEVMEANLERERQEIAEHPEEEQEEVSLYFQLKGLNKEDSDDLAEKLSHNPEAMLQVLASDELGGFSGGGNPVQASLAAGISTALGAFIPVIPFFFLRGTTAILVAAVVSLVAHFLVGAAKSLFTLRSWWAAGLEMTAAGVIVGGATYLLGLAFKVSG
jgi:VIT1/CCC1 family predicted Fe2+/Mn2+ transporter/rubrerythrin